jgi:acyl-CoA reductase-like NAD-dependent aldehyde dehydrogenase
MLVLHDADLDRAIEGAAWGSFANCGQVCVGIERIFVAQELHARFVDGLAARARTLRIGRGDEPGVDLGPLITEQHRSKVEDLVAEALERGAEAVTGARRPDVGLPGWFYEPTVLVGGDPGARIEREETFGPVVTVQPFDDEDEAVALANDSAYGLSGSIFTNDLGRALRVSRGVQTGNLSVNSHSSVRYWTPFGGYKMSGLGRELGPDAPYAFTEEKNVFIAT